ncbi:ras association domain-containing protein 5 isoform X1 [Xenopus laevis]|uniref:Ras association domain-containing protein 5 isoform X1 n=1 Tax=Xenopus laevis TaxID=8355 RepID=A0A8J1ME35_XENLA|nr:ras association domain-containing protein 5 isoform X1 [Xenopus laevis]
MAQRRTETTAACFGVVTKKFRNLFRHFPKSKSWSEGLHLFPAPSQERLIVRDYTFSHQSALDRSDLTEQFPESTTHEQKPRPHPKQDAPKEETKPTVQDLKQKIEAFNTMVQNGLIMKLADDGTFTGFIKVHLKLRRANKPNIQTPSETLKELTQNKPANKQTSFYVPLDAVKQLHISSVTTTSEVIRGLLLKFQVADDPQKFALFKHMQRDGQVLMQKLGLTEHPLYLRLLAGPETDVLSFVLKENETGEVQWDAFRVPELQNFLLILEKEERDKVQQVHKKYAAFRQHLQDAITEAKRKNV